VAPRPGSVSPPLAGEPPHADFDVHEWGLFDVPAGGRVGRLISGAPLPPAAVTAVRKPVIYLHLPPQSAPLDVAIGVQLATGVIAENFPDGTLAAGDRGLQWPHITARDGTCHNARRILSSDPSCARTSDGLCERAELERYETTDGACLLVGGVEHNHLFYRAANVEVELPIVVRTLDNGWRVAANQSSRSLGSVFLRVRTSSAAPNGIAVESFSSPAPSQQIPLWDQVTTQVDGRVVLRAATISLGLSESEADAFMRAWGDELFGAAPLRTTREARRSPVVARDELLYFLPDYVLERIAPLTIVPAPSTVHRVILVRLPVRASN
jgi:hypothetical protein